MQHRPADLTCGTGNRSSCNDHFFFLVERDVIMRGREAVHQSVVNNSDFKSRLV